MNRTVILILVTHSKPGTFKGEFINEENILPEIVATIKIDEHNSLY